MPVITLTTDWGTTDYFVGALKGELLSACPGAVIVDISHGVIKFDIAQGAYILKNAWRHFPKGTVHLVGMEPAIAGPGWLMAMEFNGHYFVGSDNGFFSLVFDSMPDQGCFVLDAKKEKVPPSIPAMASSAGFLASGGKLTQMGEVPGAFMSKAMIQPVTEDDSIKGTIIYTDSFGNQVTNITRVLVERMARGRKALVAVRSKEYAIPEISENYSQTRRGELFAMFNDAGYLEIGIRFGNAAELIGLKYGDSIRLEFT
jgi:hypothetical protein